MTITAGNLSENKKEALNNSCPSRYTVVTTVVSVSGHRLASQMTIASVNSHWLDIVTINILKCGENHEMI